MKKVLQVLIRCIQILGVGVVFMVIIGVLVSTIRGVPGNPTPEYIVKNLRFKATPFEVSPERGRYALLYSFVEHNSLEFTREVAEMVVPDLATIQGKYVSLFAPGVSFLAVPFYLLGRSLHIAQVGAFSTSTFFAFLNIIFIAIISYKLTKNFFAGLLAGITFAFGTVAWSYAATLYQHHITTFFLLVALWLLLEKRNFLKDTCIGIIVGLSVFVEYPNGIFFIPLLVLLLHRHMEVKHSGKNIRITLFLSIFFACIGFAMGMIPFFAYNKAAYDNPFQLAGTLKAVKTLEATESASLQPKTVSYKKKSILGFFRYERIPRGMDVILTSKDRGLVYYGPVIFLGLLGFFPMLRAKKEVALTIIGVLAVFLGLYSTWGDPWGGWAFGPRYLIPFTAFLAILLAQAVHSYGRKFWFGLIYFVLLNYSVAINLAGVLTTHQIPPSVEQDARLLPELQYIHNIELFYQGISDSYVYNAFLRDTTTLQTFAAILFGVVITLAVVLYMLAVYRNHREDI